MKKRGEEPERIELYQFRGEDLRIGSRTAETVLSEMGNDSSSFPNEKHFVSHASLAPQLALRTAATTLKHSKTAPGAEYRRIARKKSAGVAVFCMARKLAKLTCRMLRWRVKFKDEGLESYDTRFKEARIRSCRQFPKSLGFKLLPNEMTEARE